MNLERISSGSLIGGGLTLIGMGLYFAFLRPPLLPEDLRYIGASLAELQSSMPALLPWLDRVFGVLGGFMVVAGLMAIYFAATSKGNRAALGVVAFCGLAAVGWMVVVNFAIDSDFKWLLLALTLPWAFGLAVLAASRLTANIQA
jgi:hypothetical protein